MTLSACADERASGRPPRLQSRTDSKLTFDQIARWFRECKNDHTSCRQLHGRKESTADRDSESNESTEAHEAAVSPAQLIDINFVPTRLIDVGELASSIVHLIDTKAEGFRGPYMTLRYVLLALETRLTDCG